jgi:hypothetical protein
MAGTSKGIENLQKHAHAIFGPRMIFVVAGCPTAKEQHVIECQKCTETPEYVCNLAGHENSKCTECALEFVQKNIELPLMVWFIKTVEEYNKL